MFGLMRNNNYLRDYNPFRELYEFENDAFNSFFGNQQLDEFKTDLTDDGDHYELEADLPGFNKEDINLEVNGHELTIRAERHTSLEQKDDQNKIIHKERSYGSYSRKFDVSGIDIDKITAKYENGVLKLMLPKLEISQTHIKKLNID